MKSFLKQVRLVRKVEISDIVFEKNFWAKYSMSLGELGNNSTIHIGQAPFHTMSKEGYLEISDDTFSFLENINREFDGVEDDLIYYERWLVNSDRCDKERRHLFR